MENDNSHIETRIAREQVTKWEGDVPAEYRGIEVDPHNPPPQVKEIMVATDGGPFHIIYRRPD